MTWESVTYHHPSGRLKTLSASSSMSAQRLSLSPLTSSLCSPPSSTVFLNPERERREQEVQNPLSHLTAFTAGSFRPTSISVVHSPGSGHQPSAPLSYLWVEGMGSAGMREGRLVYSVDRCRKAGRTLPQVCVSRTIALSDCCLFRRFCVQMQPPRFCVWARLISTDYVSGHEHIDTLRSRLVNT